MDSARTTLIFLHIPKAAGMTLHSILSRQYGSRETFMVEVPQTEQCIERLKNLPEDQKKRLGVIRGHMPFGVHELLPQPATYTTMLRDPVERAISMYSYVVRKPTHRDHDHVTSSKMSFADYVESGMNPEIDNGQTRLLAASKGDVAGVFAECTRDHLERAKKNLREHFAVVGLQERFDGTLLLLKKCLGWKNIFYIRKNVSRNRPLRETIPKKTLTLVARRNRLDTELHEFARGLFEEKKRDYGKDFARDLRLFKSMNGLYSRFMSPPTKVICRLRGLAGTYLSKIKGRPR